MAEEPARQLIIKAGEEKVPVKLIWLKAKNESEFRSYVFALDQEEAEKALKNHLALDSIEDGYITDGYVVETAATRALESRLARA